MKCARVKVVFGKKEIGLVFFFFFSDFPPFEENVKNTRYARSFAEKERERERDE